MQEVTLHLERLSAKWKLKLAEGLKKLLGADNVENIHEVEVLKVDGMYKAVCPRCQIKINIQEKSRNVFNAWSFYRHVETHFENSETEADSHDDMEISSDEVQGLTPSSTRPPQRKRPRLDPSYVRSVSNINLNLN